MPLCAFSGIGAMIRAARRTESQTGPWRPSTRYFAGTLDPFGPARNHVRTRIPAEKGLTQETVDILRDHGPAWRRANTGHVSLDQLKVMSAIERCRTAALGGHVARCEDCAYTTISYNSCRNRHCPKCQGAAAREWLAEREAELLPVPYFHVVFTLPTRIAAIAYQNKAVVYDLLFKASSEAVLTIAADPEHLGARIGITAVLHTWGSTMTQNPHSRYRALSSP